MSATIPSKTDGEAPETLEAPVEDTMQSPSRNEVTDAADATGHAAEECRAPETLPQGLPRMPSGPPEAYGARFRCTCCQQEVFESQLEYHASFCLPEPEPPAPVPLSLGPSAWLAQLPRPAVPGRIEAPRKRSDSGRESDLCSWPEEELLLNASSEWEQIDLAKSPRISRAPSEERRWWRWEDSEIQIHHAQADERIAKKRQELLEEMKRREEEQCTFTPRLIARRSKSCGRMEQGRPPPDLASPCSGRWQDWLDQQLESRKSKLESVELEMYRDVTHQPQITRRSRRLAKEREAETMSVFDRLYHVARERSKARKELEAVLAADPTPLRSPRARGQLMQLFEKFGQNSKGVVFKRGMENMLGKEFNVRSMGKDGSIYLPSPDGSKGGVWTFPPGAAKLKVSLTLPIDEFLHLAEKKEKVYAQKEKKEHLVALQKPLSGYDRPVGAPDVDKTLTRNRMGYFICFDVSDESEASLKEAIAVHKLLTESLHKNMTWNRRALSPYIYLVGCKSDKGNSGDDVRRNIKKAEFFANDNDLICRITSARQQQGVSEVFGEMIQAISSRSNLWTLDGEIDENEEDEDAGGCFHQ